MRLYNKITARSTQKFYVLIKNLNSNQDYDFFLNSELKNKK